MKRTPVEEVLDRIDPTLRLRKIYPIKTGRIACQVRSENGLSVVKLFDQSYVHTRRLFQNDVDALETLTDVSYTPDIQEVYTSDRWLALRRSYTPGVLLNDYKGDKTALWRPAKKVLRAVHRAGVFGLQVDGFDMAVDDSAVWLFDFDHALLRRNTSWSYARNKKKTDRAEMKELLK